jgi:hypothetical protein
LEDARKVAAAMGLPLWWLNVQASAYVSNQYDAAMREVFDNPGIRVMAASPEHVFTVKVFASRGRDEDDLPALPKLLGSRPPSRHWKSAAKFFPDEEIPARSMAMLEAFFAVQ